MRRSHVVAAIVLALGFACTPTEPCACPPSRTHAVVYGLVRTSAGAPRGGALVRLQSLPDAECGASEHAGPSGLTLLTAGPDGRYGGRTMSLLQPGAYCVRVTAFAGAPGASDSSATTGVVLSFRNEREAPDSAEVVLELP